MTLDQQIQKYKAGFAEIFEALKILYDIENERDVSDYLQNRPQLLGSLAAIARAEIENRAKHHSSQTPSLFLVNTKADVTLSLSISFNAKAIPPSEQVKHRAMILIHEYTVAWQEANQVC
jgi:hypothetical protein